MPELPEVETVRRGLQPGWRLQHHVVAILLRVVLGHLRLADQAALQGQESELKQQAASLGGQAAGLVSQRNSLLGQIASVRAQQQAA